MFNNDGFPQFQDAINFVSCYYIVLSHNNRGKGWVANYNFLSTKNTPKKGGHPNAMDFPEQCKTLHGK